MNAVNKMNKAAANTLGCDIDEMDMSKVRSGHFYDTIGKHDMYRTYETDDKKVTVEYRATSDDVKSGTVYWL